MAEAALQAGPYCFQRLTLGEAGHSILEEWETFRRRSGADAPLYDPVWLQGYFDGQLEKLYVFLLRESGALCGVAPFLLRDWPLKWQLGEVTVAQPRLRRLRLLGGALNVPEEESTYDRLFRELANSEIGFDAIQFEEVPVESFLWKYLRESSLIRRSFRLYVPSQPLPHLEVRLSGDFDRYMKKFSAKSRNSLRRKVKRIREGALGPMRFVRYTLPGEVAPFLNEAVEVSKKTYQWNLLQKGLSRTELLRQRMTFAAERGWLRSYILFCNDVACAFFVGFQHESRFLLHETGFDPAFAKHSVGMVLHLLIIEDLCAGNHPIVFDLASYGGWKEALSTDSYLENKAMLFRPGAYRRFVQEGHHVCQAMSGAAARALERMQLKNRLKRLIRNASETPGASDQAAEATSNE